MLQREQSTEHMQVLNIACLARVVLLLSFFVKSSLRHVALVTVKGVSTFKKNP